MKKILLSLLCCLLAASACVTESTLSITNYMEYVTASGGKLLSDFGNTFTVVENSIGNEKWKGSDGTRYYMLCDILNRSMDIRLKALEEVDIQYALPLPTLEKEPDDPVEIIEHSASGNYLNLVINYTADPMSDFAHTLSFYWETKGTEVLMYLFHDGNQENAAVMEEKSLETVTRYISIPLEPILSTGEYYTMKLTFYELIKKADGTCTIERNTYGLLGNSI